MQLFDLVIVMVILSGQLKTQAGIPAQVQHSAYLPVVYPPHPSTVPGTQRNGKNIL